MTRVKATTTDIFARLARGECANFRNSSCQGKLPCTVINGEGCTYFATYVQPLLDYPEFASKYAREAKITVALNPQAKVVRKRRQAAEPKLALETKKAQPAEKIVQPTAAKQVQPATMPDTSRLERDIALVSQAASIPRPAMVTSEKHAIAPPRAAAMEQPELFSLELTPAVPVKKKR